MADTTETLFTVARGATAITGLRPTAAAAKSDLRSIETALRTAGLVPDVQLATVTRTTTLSDPAPYTETAASNEAAVEPTGEEVANDRAVTETKKSGR